MTGFARIAVSIDLGLHGNSPYVDTPFKLAYVMVSVPAQRMTNVTSDAFALAQTSVAILAIGTLMIL